nr:AAA family ATPase [Lachnospiraceae bacterium]
MKFYSIEMLINNVVVDEEEIPKNMLSLKRYNKEKGTCIAQKCEKYSEKTSDKGYLFLNSVNENQYRFGMIIIDNTDGEEYINRFIKANKITVDDIDIRETILHDISNMLRNADHNEYIYNDDEVLRQYGLDTLVGRRNIIQFDEYLIRHRNRDYIYKSVNECFTRDTLIEELDRIYDGVGARKSYGHPVNYIIECDDEDTEYKSIELLIQALYDVGRLNSKRYCLVSLESDIRFSKSFIDKLYKSCSGGAIVLDFTDAIDIEDYEAKGDYYYIDELCSVIRKNCLDVLTVICFPLECEQLRKMVYNSMGNCTFVEFKERRADNERAIAYFKERAKSFKIRTDSKLIKSIDIDKEYLVSELDEIFDVWYRAKLKSSVYTQYKNISSVKASVKDEKPKGTAYDELMSMIGLDSAKKVINSALDNYKAQKIFKDKGMRTDSLCYHMVFTGNPGTAKTTVARLFARILRDNNILSRGQMIEVGRGDLVGKYVGWTASIIKKRFREAIGGVLFIDEAYSLVDDRNGSYGDEAINTIVQEMENHRDEVIVIFAGYPDKMEGFLNKNPGLRSRIAHYIHFEDYNCDELCKIAMHIATQMGLILDEGAENKIRAIADDARRIDDFGNGRYMRNVIEKARIA